MLAAGMELEIQLCHHRNNTVRVTSWSALDTHQKALQISLVSLSDYISHNSLLRLIFTDHTHLYLVL